MLIINWNRFCFEGGAMPLGRVSSCLRKREVSFQLEKLVPLSVWLRVYYYVPIRLLRNGKPLIWQGAYGFLMKMIPFNDFHSKMATSFGVIELIILWLFPSDIFIWGRHCSCSVLLFKWEEFTFYLKSSVGSTPWLHRSIFTSTLSAQLSFDASSSVWWVSRFVPKSGRSSALCYIWISSKHNRKWCYSQPCPSSFYNCLGEGNKRRSSKVSQEADRNVWISGLMGFCSVGFHHWEASSF